MARPTAKQMPEVLRSQITPKKRVGKRVAARAKGHEDLLAIWPADHQVEVRLPQLVFVTSGQADLHFGDYTLHCGQGDGVFIPPGVPKPAGAQPHLEEERRRHGSCELLWFRPLGRRIQIWICRSHGQKHYSPQSKEIAFILNENSVRWLDDLHRELESKSLVHQEISAYLLQIFLLGIWRELREERYFHPSSTGRDKHLLEEQYNPIKRAQQYMRDHLHEKLTIENVARTVYLSRAQFAKRFREETGETFVSFLTRCRLEQAAIMLHETDFTLNYICRVLGYQSTTYFHHLFRRHYGMPPLEFRQEKQRR